MSAIGVGIGIAFLGGSAGTPTENMLTNSSVVTWAAVRSTLTTGTWTEDTTAASTHDADSPTTSGFVSGRAYTLSIEAKPNGRSWIRLQSAGSALPGTARFFDVTNGVMGLTIGSPDDTEIINVGDGWYRCCLTVTATSTNSSRLKMYMAEADNDISYDGDGSSGFLLRRPQFEESAAFTYYVETTG